MRRLPLLTVRSCLVLPLSKVAGAAFDFWGVCSDCRTARRVNFHPPRAARPGFDSRAGYGLVFSGATNTPERARRSVARNANEFQAILSGFPLCWRIDQISGFTRTSINYQSHRNHHGGLTRARSRARSLILFGLSSVSSAFGSSRGFEPLLDLFEYIARQLANWCC